MKYEKIKHYKDEEFRRLSGVKRSTFKKMIGILEEAEKKKRAEVGRGKYATDGRKVINGFGIHKRVSNILSCCFFLWNIREQLL